MGVTRVNQLSDDERARFNEWADKWIDVGLKTGPADRERFEASVRDCYRFAGIPFPKVVVWVPSPLVLALAAPTAALLIEYLKAGSKPASHQRAPKARVRDAVDGAVRGAVGGAVDGAVRGAVDGAVRGAVRDAVDGAVRDAVRGAVDGAVRGAVDGAVRGAVGGAVRGAVGGAVGDAVDDAVRDAVDGAVRDAVGGAVRGAVDGAVRDAVGDAVRDAVDDAVRDAVDGAVRGAVDDAVRGSIAAAVRDVIRRGWTNYFGGQLWVSGWYWGGAWTSFFREICHLDLPGDLWDRGRAYEGTMESACWWWPHREFVMVCERPTVIHRELANPDVSRGWGSHRLHCETGPAVAWPDGWGVWAIHGARVTQQIVEAPQTLTVGQINQEANAEVRRIMLERFGFDRYISESGTLPIHADDAGTLYRCELPDDEPLVMVRVKNSTPEPDGHFKYYTLRVPPDLTTARAAVAWTFNQRPEQYQPAQET